MVDICDFMQVVLTRFVSCCMLPFVGTHLCPSTYTERNPILLSVTAIDDLEFRRKYDHPRNVKISSKISIYEIGLSHRE